MKALVDERNGIRIELTRLFMPNGWFHVLPEIDLKKLETLFRHKVFKMLLRVKKISRELVDKLLSWKNSGFNIHNQVKIQTLTLRETLPCSLSWTGSQKSPATSPIKANSWSVTMAPTVTFPEERETRRRTDRGHGDPPSARLLRS